MRFVFQGMLSQLFQLLSILTLSMSSRALRKYDRMDMSGCKLGSRWSGWIDRNSPQTSLDGDHEFMTESERKEFCSGGVIARIECSSDAFADIFNKQEVTCDVVSGLMCRNDNNAKKTCRNYKVRYYCECPSHIETRIVRHVHCPSWSPWYNDRKPTTTDHYDREVKTRAELESFCPSGAGGDVSAVQCRDTKGEAFTGTRDVVSYTAICDLNTGLQCTPKSGYTCADFSVRYCCQMSTILPSISSKIDITSNQQSSLSNLNQDQSRNPTGVFQTSSLSSSVDTTTYQSSKELTTHETKNDQSSLRISKLTDENLSIIFCQKAFIFIAFLCIFIILTVCHCCITCRIYKKISVRVEGITRDKTPVMPMDAKW